MSPESSPHTPADIVAVRDAGVPAIAPNLILTLGAFRTGRRVCSGANGAEVVGRVIDLHATDGRIVRLHAPVVLARALGESLVAPASGRIGTKSGRTSCVAFNLSSSTSGKAGQEAA